MNFEQLDNPAVVLPRVGDVHGTLTRLGFSRYTTGEKQFYRQFVPLFEGGVPAPEGRRRISHVNILLWLVDEPEPHGKVWLTYGYPERSSRHAHIRGTKLVYGFKPLIRKETYLKVDLYPDAALRDAERLFAALIDRLMHKRIAVDKGGNQPWMVLVYSTEQALRNSATIYCPDAWWGAPEPPALPEPPPDLQRIIPANARARLPRFDQRVGRRERPRKVNCCNH